MNRKLMTDGNDMKPGPFITFLHQLCSFSTWKWTKVTYLWISAARPQCNCEPAVDGTESLYAASEKTKRVEGIGGQNDEPAWVPVTDKPLGEKDLLLLPGLWLHFHWGMCQFWIIRLKALWIKWFVFRAKEWLFLWQDHILKWKVG